MSLDRATARVRPLVLGLVVLLSVRGVYGQTPENDRPELRREAEALAARAESLRTRREVQGALVAYRRARERYRQLGDRAQVARTTGGIGVMHWLRSRYDDALRHFRTALTISREVGDREEEAVSLINIGLVHKSRGRYDNALDRYREALAVVRTIGDEAGEAVILNNVAEIYRKRGQYDEALPPAQGSLRLHRERGDSLRIAINLTNLGLIQQNRGALDEALEHHREALRINRALGNRHGVADALNNLGLTWQRRLQYNKALAHYNRSLRINREVGRPAERAINLNNIGAVYVKRGQYDEALAHYEQALALNREYGRRARTARNLRNIGDAYLRKERLTAADSSLRASVRITEDLIETATGEEQREFLDQRIHRFHSLVTVQARAERPDSALRVLERSRARLLVDRLGGHGSLMDASAPVPPVDSLQDVLGKKEAAVLYANAGTKHPVTAIVVTRAEVFVREGSLAHLEDAAETFADGRRRLREGTNLGTVRSGSLVREAERTDPENVEGHRLRELVHLYRHDLAVPSHQQILSDGRRQRLGEYLHELLLGPLDGTLAGTDELIIVPDGVLGYLPFSALPDWGGTRLLERRRVRYVQSLRVLRLLRQRHGRQHEPPRTDRLLALGNAAYEQPSTSAPAPTSPSDDGGDGRGGDAAEDANGGGGPMRDRIYERLDQGAAPVASYEDLGYGAEQWTNLPGTLQEVEAIRDIIEETTLVTGPAASEHTLRAWSRNGRLAQYEIIHVAAHGLLSPEVPALSALVLSDVTEPPARAPGGDPEEGSGRVDGYLSAWEISDLDLNAELVVLSACKTGLGRVYRGSGVVGLTQSFFEAAAAATAVSLWAVYDASTSRFMQAVYQRARRSGTTWADALAETKRAFAAGHHGERLQDPRFWAPFVYYGAEAN